MKVLYYNFDYNFHNNGEFMNNVSIKDKYNLSYNTYVHDNIKINISNNMDYYTKYDNTYIFKNFNDIYDDTNYISICNKYCDKLNDMINKYDIKYIYESLINNGNLNITYKIGRAHV